ncbi:steroid monooxygenase (HK97 family phage prohead protease) [Phlyctema vagabunda]|uniref:Steroid monooxygenase (HK97 family phage prohead protease) n=1 Tax=Phlyctema vagabunda TaxID=108571 RepID=A0ABR4PAQ5_9HELO
MCYRRFNCYPGARVDSETPLYQLNIPEVYETWTFSTNYPEWKEIQAYFDHVDKVLGLRKDTAFETVVVSAVFDEKVGRWTVKTADGRTATAKFFIGAAGFAAKRYVPEYKGLDKFKGTIHHSSFWPAEDVDVQGKKVIVVGTGASGVQISQEWGPKVKEMNVFMRTPNLALPMRRRPMSVEEQKALLPSYPAIFELREHCFAGWLYEWVERNTFDDSPEEREAVFESLWKRGGFAFWLGNYKDSLFNGLANREAYNFWAKKQRQRITNPVKRDLLCPLEPPHPFGVKRPCLEQNFYEVLDQDNVNIVDISAASGNSILEFTETGIKTTDGKHYEADVIALATGFETANGSLPNMGLQSIHGTTLEEDWKASTTAYLGVTISGYPNFFYTYGPQAPGLLANGPTAVEVQGRWIRDCIQMITRQGLKYINPEKQAELGWKDRVNAVGATSLFPEVKSSTYMGGNVPGRAREMVFYGDGIRKYREEIRDTLTGWTGFQTVMA